MLLMRIIICTILFLRKHWMLPELVLRFYIINPVHESMLLFHGFSPPTSVGGFGIKGLKVEVPS